MWAAAVGVIHYTTSIASSDNTVLLEEFTRVDGRVLQAERDVARTAEHREPVRSGYFATADGNNNITPGSPRVFRLSATANF
jgi:catecholate siderophore receptor